MPNRHGPQGRGSGYGVTNPMSTLARLRPSPACYVVLPLQVVAALPAPAQPARPAA